MASANGAVLINEPSPPGPLDSIAHLIIDFGSSGGGAEQFDISYSNDGVTKYVLDLFDVFAGQSMAFEITSTTTTGNSLDGNPMYEVSTGDRGYEVIAYGFGEFITRIDYDGFSASYDQVNFSPAFALWYENASSPGVWTFSEFDGAATLEVKDGGYYGLVYTDATFPDNGPPPAIVIPEPSVFGLVLFGSMVIGCRRCVRR
jgi:hypothetical protein